MEQRTFPGLGERMEHQMLENGLDIFVFPKPGFQKCFAFFAAHYGGMDTRFCLDGQWIDSPAGVAHFLEHKMFDTEQGNALQDLAENGASPNAFTGNSITGYYFESTQHFEENLRTLLSFVSIPWFTQESVDKEQGIIGQEIGMIEDDPDWVVFMNLMKELYAHHPVRASVAGTVESISHITAQTLYTCHKAFYAPSNMVLCVAGDVDAQRVCSIAGEILPKQPGSIAQRDYGAKEPPRAVGDYVEAEMEVSAPLFQLGFKGEEELRGPKGQRQEMLGDLACEMLLGNSTPLYAELYQKGLINQSFSYGYESDPGCAFLMAGGESPDPKAVRQAVLEEARRLAREGLDEALWQQVKKGVYGIKVQGLNSFEHLCINQAQDFFRGCDYLDFAALFDQITREEVQNLLQGWVTQERCSLSVVRPRKEGGQ